MKIISLIDIKRCKSISSVMNLLPGLDYLDNKV